MLTPRVARRLRLRAAPAPRPERAAGDGLGVVVDGLTKRFRGTVALDGVSFVVAPGETIALLGQNGAGKSTLLRIVAGVLVPDGGAAFADGVDVIEEPDAARRACGLLLGEERSHYWRLSGRANLEFFGALYGQRRAVAARRADELLGEVGLRDVADRPVGTWSTGMRMRLAVARALLGNPAVLLLDEPTRSVDPTAADDLRLSLREAAARRGLTVLLATHDVSDPAAFAARSIVLHRGRVRADLPAGTDSATLTGLMRSLAREHT